MADMDLDEMISAASQALRPQQQQQAAPQAAPTFKSPFKAPQAAQMVKTVGPGGEPVMKGIVPEAGKTVPAYEPPKSTPSYQQTLDESAGLAEDILGSLKKNPHLKGLNSWQIESMARTFWHPNMADKISRAGLGNMAASWGMPAGQIDPETADYFGKIGQLKGRLMKMYLGGRISEWATNFVQQHFPDEINMPYANEERLHALKTGLLKDAFERAEKERSRQDEAVGAYMSQGLSRDQAIDAMSKIPEKILFQGITGGEEKKKSSSDVVYGEIPLQ